VYLGPFGSARTAELVMAAVHEAIPLRQCTKRLSPNRPTSSCVLGEMGRCGAPCLGPDEGESAEQYAAHADAFRALVSRDPTPAVERLQQRIASLAEAERFEDAAFQRDRLAALVRVVTSLQRVVTLTSVPELVAARPTADLGWEITVIRHGRLVAAGVLARGAPPRPFVESLVATAETVLPGPGPLPAATAEEVRCLLRWLDSDGVRLVELDGTLASPCDGAGRWQQWLGELGAVREAAAPFEDRRPFRTLSQPARATA
jgi:DNA polymerase-3 subunit epsilon